MAKLLANEGVDILKNSPKVTDGNGPMGDFLTIPQIAEKLQVCTKTVRRIIKELNIPIMRVGSENGPIRILAEYLPLFLKKKW